MRIHKKVWLWWGPRWALQFYRNKYVSFGIHLDFFRLYIDIHFLWFILSFGDNPVITSENERFRGCCRGFLFEDDPIL